MKERTVFNFDNEITIQCWVQRYGQGMAQMGDVYQHGQLLGRARYSYLNRTWESFQYESVLENASEKFFDGALSQAIEDIATGKRNEVDAFISQFKNDYDSLHENTKKHLANANIELTSIEQAKDVMKISKAFDVLLNM